MGGEEARPESARASASMAQAQELSGQLGLCLPTELRENEFLERLYLNGQAKALAPHPSEPLFGGIRRWWVGEACTVYWGLGPRALESFSKFRKEEGGRMLPSGEEGQSLSPLPPGSPCSSPEVPSHTADPDLQDREKVEIPRAPWLGECAAHLPSGSLGKPELDATQYFPGCARG